MQSFAEQRALGLPYPGRVQTRGVQVGALLGMLNTLFVAIAFSFRFEWHDQVLLATVIFLFGLLPGVLTGMLLGRVGIALARRPVALRCVALALPAIGFMVGWSAMFGLAMRFALGVIPTTVCALILERYTRARSELPAATVQS
ncbi:hypothetical protein BH11MYX1_BH11MYX1_47550 [soil metagenome]